MLGKWPFPNRLSECLPGREALDQESLVRVQEVNGRRKTAGLYLGASSSDGCPAYGYLAQHSQHQVILLTQTIGLS